MKFIFLDIDGVLNTYQEVMRDEMIRTDLVANLAAIVKRTGAKIVLTSSWRLFNNMITKIMDAFNEFDLSLYGMTQEGVSKRWLVDHGINVKPCPRYDWRQDELCYDRGAEIFYWLFTHYNHSYENFIILDDEVDDIKNYFKSEYIVQTTFKSGLTQEKVNEAVTKLEAYHE